MKMLMSVCLLLLFQAAATTRAETVPSDKPGGVVIIEAGAPTSRDPDGKDDTIEFELLNDGGSRLPYAVQVHIPRGIDPVDKATRIADAIRRNPFTRDRVEVHRARHVLTIEAKPPFQGLLSIGTTNKSRQTGMRRRVTYPADTAALLTQGVGVITNAPPPQVARVIQFGFPGPGVVEVGTDRAVARLDPAGFSSVGELNRALVDLLRAQGVVASLENPWSIRIDLIEELDGSLQVGNSVEGIEQFHWVGGR